MAGGIGDDELTLCGTEITVRDIDGDALLPLGLQAIGDQSRVELAARRADFAAIRFQLRDMVFIQHLAIK